MDILINTINSLPGAVAQGLIWGIMAIGLYITYRILDIADLTVDGSICTGGAVCVMLIMNGCSVPLAMLAALGVGMLTGLATGIFHTVMGIPAILAGILTQLSLYSINLKILGKANQAISTRNYDLLVSLNYIKGVPFYKNTIFVIIIAVAAIIAVLYWFFGTELGCSIRATGSNLNMSRAQGNKHKVQHRAGTYDIQRDSCLVRRFSGSVSGLCRCKYGQRRYSYRTCRRYNRTGAVRQNIPQLCAYAAQRGNRRRYILYCLSGCDMCRT